MYSFAKPAEATETTTARADDAAALAEGTAPSVDDNAIAAAPPTETPASDVSERAPFAAPPAQSHGGYGMPSYADHENADPSAYPGLSPARDTEAPEPPPQPNQEHHHHHTDTSHHDNNVDEEEDEVNAQIFTDYHGGADRLEARGRRLQQQQAYDDIPMPPDDAAPQEVFAYYRKLIGLVTLVPPKHWREIRFDLPANVAELRLFPQRRERIQDREPVRPSSTVVISLEGTLPENTTPAEYEAQMVQYFLDLLQYQNATSAITALRFVKKGTELSQMVVTLGRDARLTQRVLTEIQAAGLRAHYGMIIFEHPPNATFQVVDYRRTLHDGKGISAEDIAFLLEPMRPSKTVDINVIEGYEPGVFYAPVKRPEAIYAFLWNYFCSYKFQSDLFRRYGVLVTMANCPHDFLKKGIPYFIQKRELEEKIKAELLRKGFEERDGGPGSRAGQPDDEDDSSVDSENAAEVGGEGPPPAWAVNAEEAIDIFGDASSVKHAPHPNSSAGAAAGGEKASDMIFVDEDAVEDVDALLQRYNVVPEPPSGNKTKDGSAKVARKGKDNEGAGSAQPPAPPPPPPQPLSGFVGGPAPAMRPPTGAGPYGWGNSPLPPPPQQQQPSLPLPMKDPYFSDPYANRAPPLAGGPPFNYYGPPPPPPQQAFAPFYRVPIPDSGGYGAYPAPQAARYSDFVGEAGPSGPGENNSGRGPSYPLLNDEAEDEEEVNATSLMPQATAASTTPKEQPAPYAAPSTGSLTASGGSPHFSANGKEGLLSWSMDAARMNEELHDGNTRSSNNSSGWQLRGGREDWRQSSHHFAPEAPPPALQQRQAGDYDVLLDEDNGANGVENGGGMGILGDSSASVNNAPFYGSGESTLGGGAVGHYGEQGQQQEQQQQQGWGGDASNTGNAAYDAMMNPIFPNSMEGWMRPQDGRYPPGESYGDAALSPEQALAMMPPHVREAAQITEDLEERLQSAFPALWRAATAVDAEPLRLDGEAIFEEEDEENHAEEEACVLNFVSAKTAARDAPQPTSELEDLLDFLHRNVGLVGRLLHKTTTTTVAEAREVAPYRARVARALLIGVTATQKADAWRQAWTPQRADGETFHDGEDDDITPTHEGESRGAAVAAAASVEGEEAPEGDAELQLPSLLPYLLRTPAGMDLALLLALHYPRAFARRFLPYAPAFLLEEAVVRVVLTTVLRRDPRPSNPLVHGLLSHWCPLLSWLKEFVSLKAAPASAPSPDGSDTSASAAAAAAAVTKQLVSLLSNTTDVLLAGLSPAQRAACHDGSAAQDYVERFVEAMEKESASLPPSDTAVLLPALWGPPGALYRSLLRLFINGDGCDGATLAQRLLTRVQYTETEVCLTREHFFYGLVLLSRSQTAPVLSRETASFCGAFLQLLERQHAQRQAAEAADAPLQDEARQLLETALQSVRTREAYAALRDAYLRDSGSLTRFDTVLAQLSAVEPPPPLSIEAATYAEWYSGPAQQQRRNAEATQVPSIFYYQPPSRRTNVNKMATPAWNRAPQGSASTAAPSSVFPSVDSVSPPSQTPAWATVPDHELPAGTTGAKAGPRSLLAGGGSRAKTAAQLWRPEWTDTMRVYPVAGTPFDGALPEGWTSALSRRNGHYVFEKRSRSNEQGTDNNEAEKREKTDTTEGASIAGAPGTEENTSPAPTATTTSYKHPVDDKEYVATPQAFLKEATAQAEDTPDKLLARANALKVQEAAAAGLPPGAPLRLVDMEDWMSDQRRRNVFFDVATLDVLEVQYRSTQPSSASAAGGTLAAGAVGLKRGREAANVARAPLTPEEQEAQLRKIIPDSYPAVGVPYPALFPGWSVYYNSARGQYGFTGPHHGAYQPPLFIHPKTRKHYFVSPQAFVRQRKILPELIAREADVPEEEVGKWLADQRIRHPRIDSTVIRMVPICYGDVDRWLEDNAAATAAAATASAAAAAKANVDRNDTVEEDKKRSGNNASSPVSSSNSNARDRRRQDKNERVRDRDRQENRSKNNERGSRRRRRRDDSESDYGSYSDEEEEEDRHRRRGHRGGRRGGNKGGGGGGGGRRRR